MLKFKKIVLPSILYLGLSMITFRAHSDGVVQNPVNPNDAEKVTLDKIENRENVNNSQNNDLEDCRKLIQNLGNDAIRTLKGSKDNRREREEQFRPLFIKNFDVAKIGKFVLGKYGRGSIKPEEQQEFLEIFQKTIVSIYANRLGKYDDEKFKVGEANYTVNEPNDKLVRVESKVHSKNRNPINIAWSVAIKNDQKGIVDVTIEGVSQAFTQQQEYGDTLRNGGIRELIKKLKNKYEQSSSAKQP